MSSKNPFNQFNQEKTYSKILISFASKLVYSDIKPFVSTQLLAISLLSIHLCFIKLLTQNKSSNLN